MENIYVTAFIEVSVFPQEHFFAYRKSSRFWKYRASCCGWKKLHNLFKLNTRFWNECTISSEDQKLFTKKFRPSFKRNFFNFLFFPQHFSSRYFRLYKKCIILWFTLKRNRNCLIKFSIFYGFSSVYFFSSWFLSDSRKMRRTLFRDCRWICELVVFF